MYYNRVRITTVSIGLSLWQYSVQFRIISSEQIDDLVEILFGFGSVHDVGSSKDRGKKFNSLISLHDLSPFLVFQVREQTIMLVPNCAIDMICRVLVNSYIILKNLFCLIFISNQVTSPISLFQILNNRCVKTMAIHTSTIPATTSMK